MKRGKSRSQATLKSQSSHIQEREEVVLPPLDVLKVNIKSLRLASGDRGLYTVTVTFFDQLLFSENITPIGAKDSEESGTFYGYVIGGAMCFDPSDYAKMCLFADNPLIVRIQPMDRSGSMVCTSCCNIDILPLFQGETKLCFSKRMEPMIEPTALQIKSWDNLPLITVEVQLARNLDNKIHHQLLNAANVMTLTLVAAYNVIVPFNETSSYVAASKIRLSNEETSGIETFKQGLPVPKRFSVTGFYPKWESITWGDIFRKSDEKVCLSLDSVQNNDNINLKQYLENKNQDNTVVWGSFHRTLVLPVEERPLARHIRQYQWPLEFHMYADKGGYSFMGFMDLFRLLYPGETTVRLAVPLYWVNAAVMLEKCGCEPLLTSNEKSPRSGLASVGYNPTKEMETTSGSALVDVMSLPPPTGVDDGCAFVIVEVRMARPLVKPAIPPIIPESDIKKMLDKKKEDDKKNGQAMPTCTGRGQLNKEWRETVTSAANSLRKVPYFGMTDFCTFNRQLSETRMRVELTTSFWQDAAVYINNNYVVQDFLHSDEAFEEMIMMAHPCLMREAGKILLGGEPEQDLTLRAARHARQHQDIPHATELYLQLVTENQNNANSWRELATCFMDADAELAKVCINEALLLNPRHPLTLLSKASMLYEEDPESAELFLKAILALYPFWVSGWVVAKAFYLERQEYHVADKIKKLINQTRSKGLAEDLAPHRGWEKELGDWWYPTPLLPGSSHFFEAADLLLRLRGMPLAEVCLARALSSHGETPAYSHLVALSCRLRGDIDNALCHIRSGYDAFGEVSYLRSLEAECLSKLKDRTAALTAFEKAGNSVNSYSILNCLPCREPQRTRGVLVELLRRQPSAYAWMALANDWVMRQAAAGGQGGVGGAGDADAEVAMSACAEACAEQALKWDRRCAAAWALLARLARPRARRDYCRTMATAFPLKVCFAMTINKSQGQTLKFAGVDLREHCFSHGQFYVACSRLGYKWSEAEQQRPGSDQSLCYRLGKALKECRCNLCETSEKHDSAHLECECVKSILL